MVGSGRGLPRPFGFPISEAGLTPIHLLTTAAAVRMGSLLRFHHHHLRLLLRSSFKKLSHLGHFNGLKNAWHDRDIQFKEISFRQFSSDALASICSSCLCLFGGEETGKNYGNKCMSIPETSRKKSLNRRRWTNILLAINVLVYIAQTASRGKLMLWGAKINSFIDQGQLWRLATSSFLHANIGHLLVNCYSLNSVGPSVESISGPIRYLAAYFTSAIASSATSYWFCKAPAVGASGAIFGLVGSFSVFIMRHRALFGGGKEALQRIARVIILNMVVELLSRGTDNWGHLGGLLGGAAASWFLGPVWKDECESFSGRRTFKDGAPVFSLFRTGRYK